MNYLNLPPDPSSLVESMRDIGYSMETAIADLVDNSLTAGAKSIDIFHSWNGGEPWLAIVDDGKGMNSTELTAAMRLGSRNPLEERSISDLGRFGLGLKTASFSQCRQLTVISRSANSESAEGREWNLDRLCGDGTETWGLRVLDAFEMEATPAYSKLGKAGTLVVWRLMDRLDNQTNLRLAEQKMNELLILTRDHLQLVFHRFLGSQRQSKVKIAMNAHSLQPFDPFHTHCPATQHLPSESMALLDSTIKVQPYILPHHTKVSKTLYEKYAGPNGYRRSQGFYVYRNQRLIIWATWFRLGPQDELTKLARVKIDIPNTVDHLWQIDIKKSRANPPELIKNRLRQIVDRIRDSGAQVYKQKGSRLHSVVHQPLWNRNAAQGKIQYEINRNHILVSSLLTSVPSDSRQAIQDVLRALESRFPLETLYNDMAAQPEDIKRPDIDENTLLRFAETTVTLLKKSGIPDHELREKLSQMDPFASQPGIITHVLSQIGDVGIV